MCLFIYELFNIRDMSVYVEVLCKEIWFYLNFENIFNRFVLILYFGGGIVSILILK